MLIHRAIRTGGILSVCIAAVLLLLTLQWFTVRRDTDAQILTANSSALLNSATVRIRSKEVTALIAAYKKAAENLAAAGASLQGRVDSDDVSGIIANLTVASRSSIELIAAAKKTTDASIQTQQQFQETLKQFAKVAQAADKTITDAHALITNKDFQEGYKAAVEALKHMDSATASVDDILDGLAHPEKPSKFIRALGFALGLLRTAGQARPLFP